MMTNLDQDFINAFKWPGVPDRCDSPEGAFSLCSESDGRSSRSNSVSSSDGRKMSRSSKHIINPTRYKTEQCRTYQETGSCKYGSKCQFAHGFQEIRGVPRHPKYKTEMCRSYHTTAYCPYGSRCHFIHNEDELELIRITQIKQQQFNQQLMEIVQCPEYMYTTLPTATYPAQVITIPITYPIPLPRMRPNSLSSTDGTPPLSPVDHFHQSLESANTPPPELPRFAGFFSPENEQTAPTPRRLPVFSNISNVVSDRI